MHAVIRNRNKLKVKVAHAVDLELEGKCWLQVAIDAVLLELKHADSAHFKLKYSSFVVHSDDI